MFPYFPDTSWPLEMTPFRRYSHARHHASWHLPLNPDCMIHHHSRASLASRQQQHSGYHYDIIVLDIIVTSSCLSTDSSTKTLESRDHVVTPIVSFISGSLQLLSKLTSLVNAGNLTISSARHHLALDDNVTVVKVSSVPGILSSTIKRLRVDLCDHNCCLCRLLEYLFTSFYETHQEGLQLAQEGLLLVQKGLQLVQEGLQLVQGCADCQLYC